MKAESHFFEVPGGKRYCLDVNSSAVFEIGRITEEIIRRLPIQEVEEIYSELSRLYPRDELSEAMQTVQQLQHNGFWAWNSKAEKFLDVPGRYELNLLGLSLMVTNVCNLDCAYCFNNGGAVDKSSVSVMDFKVSKCAVDFLLKNSNGPIGIDFFGGEPLLAFDLIRKTVEYALSSGRECQFSMITNGTLVDDEILHFLAKQNFHVVISYDGYMQDTLRKSKDGKESSERIRSTVKALAGELARKDISLRCILNHRTNDLNCLVREAQELGVRLVPGLITAPNNPLDLTGEDFQNLKKFEEDYLFGALDAGSIDYLTGATNLINTVLQAADAKQRYYSCGVGKDILAVSITGDIYPCHRFIGLEELKMGSLSEGLCKEIYRSYADLYVDARASCANCWARYFCGGGCAHESYAYNGNVGKAVSARCDLIRHETELGLKLYATLSHKHPQYIEMIRQSYELPMVKIKGGLTGERFNREADNSPNKGWRGS